MTRAFQAFIASHGSLGAFNGPSTPSLRKLTARSSWVTCPLPSRSTTTLVSRKKREVNTPLAFHKPSFEPAKDWHVVSVLEKRKVCQDGYLMNLEVPISVRCTYTTPGMYIQLRDKKTSRPRLVALSSAPHLEKPFQVFIKASSDFPWIEEVKVGDEIQMSSVMGSGFANAFGNILELKGPKTGGGKFSIFCASSQEAAESSVLEPAEDTEIILAASGWLASPLKSAEESTPTEAEGDLQEIDVLAVGSGWLASPLKVAMEATWEGPNDDIQDIDVIAVGSGWLASPLKAAMESTSAGPKGDIDDIDVIAVGSGWLASPLKAAMESASAGPKGDLQDIDVLAVGSGWLASPLKATMESDRMDVNIGDTSMIGIGKGFFMAAVRALTDMWYGVKDKKRLNVKKRNIKFIYEMPSPELDPWVTETTTWARCGVEVIPVMSKPKGEWNGRTGTAEEVLKEIGVKNPKRTVALLSAPKDAVEEMKAYLMKCGVPENMIFCPFDA